ncbi:hypothetical protein HDU93_008432 [Gonapodya sp. JEL0774]|nr:hypothetical protein HDU93_008432 [Gonapodya sp. JEL0774]
MGDDRVVPGGGAAIRRGCSAIKSAGGLKKAVRVGAGGGGPPEPYDETELMLGAEGWPGRRWGVNVSDPEDDSVGLKGDARDSTGLETSLLRGKASVCSNCRPEPGARTLDGGNGCMARPTFGATEETELGAPLVYEYMLGDERTLGERARSAAEADRGGTASGSGEGDGEMTVSGENGRGGGAAGVGVTDFGSGVTDFGAGEGDSLSWSEKRSGVASRAPILGVGVTPRFRSSSSSYPSASSALAASMASPDASTNMDCRILLSVLVLT